MADKDQRDDAEGSANEEESRGKGGGGSKGRSSNGRPAARELVERARDELVAITGRPAFGVSGLTKSEDGWIVRVDLVELERIPPSTNVLASYEVELDGDGELVGYERTRRYHLSQTDE